MIDVRNVTVQTVFRIVSAVTIPKNLLWYWMGYIVIFNCLARIVYVALLLRPLIHTEESVCPERCDVWHLQSISRDLWCVTSADYAQRGVMCHGCRVCTDTCDVWRLQSMPRDVWCLQSMPREVWCSTSAEYAQWRVMCDVCRVSPPFLFLVWSTLTIINYDNLWTLYVLIIYEYRMQWQWLVIW